ncbi:penicillin acylase family protein [Kiloniella laminariae]|uniref:Penicillin acylase family protein n=1 Tax=Kiloniella laminariae TaxID=454162 RepID=A0ABT4LGC8_9PROT|nr:penicillin acylase family protein [Kiloniella laminariae]MCZ4280154.1 penicillin acylase family protein [Kiloniella laminariae]
MIRFFRFFSRAVLALICLLLLLSLGAYLWLRSSLPQMSGEITLQSLQEPAIISRDQDGLTTIRARNEADAFRALGFAHAQDRLWQMDFMRRAGAGRLSEVSGQATLEIDRFMRTLGLYRLAEANYQQLSPATKMIFEAYSEGVNAYIAQHQGILPPEFLLLEYTPEPWQPIDSLVWGRLMALQLSDNFNRELLRQRLFVKLPSSEIDQLWPQDPADPGIIVPEKFSENQEMQELNKVAGGEIPLPWPLAPKDASNAWVIAAERSTTGGAILANDPHLALDAPGPWYLARIETPGFTWAGATAPGVPLMVLGHNGHIAWGFTTTHGDTQDLFIEQVAQDDPEKYLTPKGYKLFDSRIETIRIKDQPDHKLAVRLSRHGPIISPVLRQTTATGSAPLALSWAALREDDKTAEALFNINRAHNWQEFEAALENFHSPQQTLVMADTSGNIALAAAGRVPLRRDGDGRYPAFGATDLYDWTGFIPDKDRPQSVNPANGKLVTANNRLVGPEYPYLITQDWPNSYRARRIHQLIDAKEKLSLEDNIAIQMDTLSLAAQELLPLLLEIETTAPQEQRILEKLGLWNGDMRPDINEPVLFHRWIYWLNRTAFGQLPSDSESFQSPDILRLARLIQTRPENWCQYGEKLSTELTSEHNCRNQLAASLKQLALEIPDPDLVQNWGESHKVHFKHPIYDRIPVLDRLFRLEIATAGSHDTVNRGSPSLHESQNLSFPNVHGPSFRAVYDLTNLDNSSFLLATGQSGNPLSGFYGNFLSRWRDGIYVKLDGSQKQHTGDHLALIPEK